MKYCSNCGSQTQEDDVLCPNCGKSLHETPTIVINNTNTNTNTNTNVNARIYNKACNKWVSFFLCLFLGLLGAHKFYEGKIGIGIVYLFTGGLFGIGWLIDLITILTKPNPYYIF